MYFVFRPYNGGTYLENSANLEQLAHTHTNPRPDQYLTHAHSHVTRAVAAMDSCLALTGAHQHGIAVGQWTGKTLVFFLVSRRTYMADCNAKSPI